MLYWWFSTLNISNGKKGMTGGWEDGSSEGKCKETYLWCHTYPSVNSFSYYYSGFFHMN